MLLTQVSKLPDHHKRKFILAGPLGTAQTIHQMRGLVTEATRDLRNITPMRNGVTRGKRVFEIRRLIGNIIRNCPGKDYYCYARTLYEYCRDQIKYAFDPVGVELIEAPERILLESRIADCDSIVVVLATLYEAIGLPARFVTIRADMDRPQDYSHVYVEVNIPNRGWIAADPTMPGKQFGWHPDARFPAKRWPASLDPDSDVRDDILEPQAIMAGMGKMNNDVYANALAFGRRWTQPMATVAAPPSTSPEQNGLPIEPPFVGDPRNIIVPGPHPSSPVVKLPVAGWDRRGWWCGNPPPTPLYRRRSPRMFGMGDMTLDQKSKSLAMYQGLMNAISRVNSVAAGLTVPANIQVDANTASTLLGMMRDTIAQGSWADTLNAYRAGTEAIERVSAYVQKQGVVLPAAPPTGGTTVSWSRVALIGAGIAAAVLLWRGLR